MLVKAIALILGGSILFYCLFAGADFGGGMLELFAGKRKNKEQDEVVSDAIAPVWEANHVWIILAVVILFNGFPKAFSEISIHFHIPILIMLMGIVLRGCAFTFRRYDAVIGRTQKYYTFIFMGSSFLTPLMLGVIAGGLFLGRVTIHSTNFYSSYLEPWLNMFCFSVGIFVCTLFTFLAAVYLIGESEESELKEIFVKRALIANVLMVLTGALVFFWAQIDKFPLIELFLKNVRCVSCMGLATTLLLPLWVSLRRQKILMSRIFAAAQFSSVLLGWYSLQYPALLIRKNDALTIFNTAAPEPTLRLLLYSLIFGMLLIFPALFYLLKTFKSSKQEGS